MARHIMKLMSRDVSETDFQNGSNAANTEASHLLQMGSFEQGAA
jgi:hypothetical protein